MSKTLRAKFSNTQIIGFMVILGLFVFSMSGCQQVNDLVNGNKATNSNAAANTNATSNANSNAAANSDANADTSVSQANSAANANNQASNTAATKEEIPLSEEAKVFKNNLVGEWMDDTNQKHKFTENTYEVNIGTRDYQKGSYKVVNENTLELVKNNGDKWNATMTIEDNGNTLLWKDSFSDHNFKFSRVKPN
jgi:hypothetical protein